MNYKLLLFCGVSLGCCTFPAHAQDTASNQDSASNAASEDSSGSGGQIVVTATRRSTTLREVPQSIQALSSDMLETRGVTDLDSLGRQTPGLVMSENADRTPNVVIRGIGAFGNTQGVGYYIDDVQNFTDQTMLLQDLERVEILKGPQGTLYGGSSIGGAIRYITRQPDFDFGAAATAEAGGYGYRNVYASINAPISEDTVALRISGYYTTDDGFWESPDFNDISNFEEYLIRGQLLIQASDALTIRISGRYRSYDGGGLIASGQNAVDQVNYVADLSVAPMVSSETFGVVGSLNYDFGDVELDFISSFTRQDKDFLGDVDYTTAAVPGIVIYTDDPRAAAVQTHEFRLSSSNNDTIDWIFGLYAANLRNVNLTATPVTLQASVPGLGVVLEVPKFFDYRARQFDMAAFGSVDVNLGNLTATAGARLYHVDYDADLFTSFGAPVNLHFNNNDTVVLPRVALSYMTDGGTNIYASVSRGYEPGRAALSSATPQTYEPERTWAFEVGAKGNIGGNSLYYEIAGFYTIYEDRQFETRLRDPATGAIFETIGNVGDSTAYGLEALVNWEPVTGLTLTGALGYLHSEWDDGATFNLVPIAGFDTPNAPEWTANIGATYSAPVSNSLMIELHADAAYTDDFRWKLGYEPVSSINPSQWLASASLAISDVDERWRVSARVSNLFNTDYFIDFTPENLGPQNVDGTCNACHLGYVGDRRRVIVSVSMRY